MAENRELEPKPRTCGPNLQPKLVRGLYRLSQSQVHTCTQHTRAREPSSIAFILCAQEYVSKRDCAGSAKSGASIIHLASPAAS